MIKKYAKYFFAMLVIQLILCVPYSLLVPIIGEMDEKFWILIDIMGRLINRVPFLGAYVIWYNHAPVSGERFDKKKWLGLSVIGMIALYLAEYALVVLSYMIYIYPPVFNLFSFIIRMLGPVIFLSLFAFRGQYRLLFYFDKKVAIGAACWVGIYLLGYVPYEWYYLLFGERSEFFRLAVLFLSSFIMFDAVFWAVCMFMEYALMHPDAPRRKVERPFGF